MEKLKWGHVPECHCPYCGVSQMENETFSKLGIWFSKLWKRFRTAKAS